MNRPHDPDARLAAWLDQGPTSGPDDGLSSALARAHSTHQRPGWLVTLRGGTMETTWRARPVLSTRLAFALLITMLVLALAAGAAIVGARLSSTPLPNQSHLAAALLPTACPAGTPLKSGDIATVGGTGSYGHAGDNGPATMATIASNDWGTITTDHDGALYFSQEGTSIRRVGTDGIISTFAAPTGGPSCINPTGLSFDTSGNLFVADTGAGRVWKLDPAGTVTPVAGNGTVGSTGDEGPALNAEINALGVVVGPRGDLYLDDATKWRNVDPSGAIHTFAGTGTAGFSGDGGAANKARFGGQDLGALGVDALGNVYLGDDSNLRLRRVDPAGIITTIAGTGSYGYSGDGGPAVDAKIGSARAAAADAVGNVYFVDTSFHVVRKIDANGQISTVAGTGKPGFSGDCGPGKDAALNQPVLIAVHDGIVYIDDFGNQRIRMIVP